MNFKDYLHSREICTSLYNKPENIEQICEKNICTKRDFDDYESFYDFVMKHYQLKHLQEHNYIKFVNIVEIDDNTIFTKYSFVVGIINKNIKI